jgi:hypothetical protein
MIRVDDAVIVGHPPKGRQDQGASAATSPPKSFKELMEREPAKRLEHNVRNSLLVTTKKQGKMEIEEDKPLERRLIIGNTPIKAAKK